MDGKSSPFRILTVNKQQINLASFIEKQNGNHADFTVPLTANTLTAIYVDFIFNKQEILNHFSKDQGLYTLTTTTPKKAMENWGEQMLHSGNKEAGGRIGFSNRAG